MPRNIYELGFKAFADQPGFISAYVTFLISQGDVDNARQLFERALAQPGPPLAIWDAYLAVRLPCLHAHRACRSSHVSAAERAYAVAIFDLMGMPRGSTT